MFIVGLFVCLFVTAGANIREAGFGFNYLSRTNTKNITLPVTRKQAESMGWVATQREDGAGICRKGLGVEYTEGGSSHSKSRPLSLFFEAHSNGRISAFSVRAWFTNSSHYNPNTWKLPTIGSPEDGERWITVTTRNPQFVCSSSNVHNSAMLGDRLLINVDEDGEEYLKIPTTAPSTNNGPWKFGACQADMSRHWGYPLDGNATQLYGFDHGIHVLPIIPMYSVPQGENAAITALAFFTTEAQQTYSEGGIWDATGTPAQLCAGNFCIDENLCEYGEGNSVLHIFFVDQWAEVAQCGPGGSPDCPSYVQYPF